MKDINWHPTVSDAVFEDEGLYLVEKFTGYVGVLTYNKKLDVFVDYDGNQYPHNDITQYARINKS